jgi:class 3 adenylate cyclase
MVRMSATERARLPDGAFAYVDARGRRRLPIHDEAHVRNALGRFERVAFESDIARERARTRLLRAARRHGIVPVGFITGQIQAERRTPTSVSSLPTGAVTFLMTDIEASTQLLHALGDGYAAVLAEVRRIHRRAVRAVGGHEVDARADEYFACFERPAPAVAAALAIQRRIAEGVGANRVRVRVRAGIHGGRPTLTEDGYVGLSVHMVARICAVARGGQVLISERTHDGLAGALPAASRVRSVGVHALRGIPGEHRLYEVTPDPA